MSRRLNHIITAFTNLLQAGSLMLLCLLVSCSSHEDTISPDPDSSPDEFTTPIRFNGKWQEPEETTTRATRPLEEVYTAFRVYAFKNMSEAAGSYGDMQQVMDDYRVVWQTSTAGTTPTNTHDWDYVLAAFPNQSVKYWDWSALAYRFFGTTGDNSSVIEDVTAPYPANEPQEDHTTCRISIPTDARTPESIPYYSHLWFSTGELPTYADRQWGQPVVLTFVQPIVKVRFMFVSGDPSVELATLELTAPSFRPANIAKHITHKGTVVVSYPITGTATTESWAVTPDNETFLTAFTTPWTEANDYWATVLPARQADQGPYQLTVRVNGEEKQCAVPAQYMEWLPGYNYTYVFKVNSDLGVELGTIHAAYTDWKDGKQADYTIYNW